MTAVDVPAWPRSGVAAHTADPTLTVDDVFGSLGAAVHGYVRSAGAHDSEDVLGEVFVRVARGLGRFRGDERDLRRWVFTIAHNCLMDEHRRRARERLLLRRWAARPATFAVDETFDPALHEALLRLTQDQRDVVTLRFVADLSLEEVGRITGRPAGAVKSLQHRALRNLAISLGERSPAEGGTGPARC